MAKYFKVDANRITRHRYPNGRISLLLSDEMGLPEAKLSVNIPHAPLEKDEVFIKTHSENEGLLEDLVKLKLVEVVDYVESGHVQIPRCKWLGK